MSFRNFPIILLTATFFSLSSFAHCAEDDWIEKKSTHFIVSYKKGVDQDFIADIIETAEQYYDEIASNLGYYRYKFWLWDDRARIYIFPDQASFQQEMKQPNWSGGCASYYDKNIWTFPHAAGFFDSILPHELGHIIFREFAGFNNNIPLWFEEGIASYQEKSKRYAAKNLVKELLAKKELLSIEELSKVTGPQDLIDGGEAEVFYAEAVSIIYFLISKYGDHSFAKLCKTLKDNVSFDNALKKTYYNIKNTEDLQKEWIRYLNQ